jgi:1-deoxy-D-xylulose 5-phosphate reductoisomerase
MPFTAIARVIAETLDAVPATEAASLEAVMAADADARREALARVAALTAVSA